MKRVLTAFVLGALALYTVLAAHPFLFMAVLAVFALGCYYEYANLVAAHGYNAGGPVGYAAGLVLLILPNPNFLLFTVVALLGLALAMRGEDLSKALTNAAALALGVAYVFGAWKCAPLLREVSPYWLLFAMSVNWIADTAAFVAGKTLGRHKLAPKLSPGKTWEGAAAGVAVAVVFGIVFLRIFLPHVSPIEASAIAAVACVAGQVGDLAESALKRGAGVKDSGNVLPGHGGLLDRLDSTLFALPVVYAWVVRPW
ncbi:MAG: phosphatidate cytidylyltransferase [Bryobacteraceae bacterium]|nr:phosphatidate cytidylyltransferase [Bryobacteraceae bacterium]